MESDVKEVSKAEGNWRVDEEDEARYNFSTEKGLWEPKPEDILSMFEELAKGGALSLQWTCPGRRPPESEQEVVKKEETEMEVDKEETREEESREPEPCAFDFDDTQSESGMMKTTPIRALGGPGRTPKTEKRVARMDNIMDSLRKQQIQRAAEREARKAKASPSRTPQGRGGRLLKFGAMSQSPKNVGRPEVKKAAPVMAIGQSPPAASSLGPAHSSAITTSSEPSMSLSSSTASSSPSLPVQPTTTVAASNTSNTSTSIAPNSTTTNQLSTTAIPLPEQSTKPSESDAKSLFDRLKNITTNASPLPGAKDGTNKLNKSDALMAGTVSSQSSSEKPKMSATVTNPTATSTSPYSFFSVTNNVTKNSAVEVTPSSHISTMSSSTPSPVTHTAASALPAMQTLTASAPPSSKPSVLPSTISSHTQPTPPPPQLITTTKSNNDTKPQMSSSSSDKDPNSTLNAAPSVTQSQTETYSTPVQTLTETTTTSATTPNNTNSSSTSTVLSPMSKPTQDSSTIAAQQSNDQQKSVDVAPIPSETSSGQDEKDQAKESS